MKKLLLILAISLMVSSVLADATWKNAVDGDWRTADNWVDSVLPSASGRTYLTPDSDAYTVSLGAGDDVTTKGLTIIGSMVAPYSTELNIANTKLVVDGGLVTNRYGVIRVGTGGELEFKNMPGAGIGVGGKIEVDGGALVMTNNINTGNISFNAGNEGTSKAATLSIKSGDVYVCGDREQLMIIGGENYGKFEMTGGKMHLIRPTNSSQNFPSIFNASAKNASDLVFSMSGDSEFVMPSGGHMFLGHGISEIKGSAKLTMSSDKCWLSIAPYYSSDWRQATVNISGDAKFDTKNAGYFQFGKQDFRPKNTRGILNISGGDLEMPLRSAIGAGQGLWTMNMTGGTIAFPRYGVRIGAIPFVPSVSYLDIVCSNKTVVTISGGTFSCTAEESMNTTPKKEMWGFIVGAGLVGRGNTNLANGWVDACVNLQSGGTITNGCALKMVGVGRGIGRIVQTGGTYVGVSSTAYAHNNRLADSLVLGAFGGNGTYDLQGGTAKMNCPMFVGGTTLAQIFRTDEAAELPANTAGKAVGLLKVSGGTMTVANSCWVGTDGRGTVDVSGSSSLSFGWNLVLTNSVADAATLKVKIADGAIPTIRVTNSLIVYDGAKLVVDATGLTGDENLWVKIVDVVGGRTGSFDPANITVVGKGEIVQNRSGDSTGSIWYHRKGGFVLTYR